MESMKKETQKLNKKKDGINFMRQALKNKELTKLIKKFRKKKMY